MSISKYRTKKPCIQLIYVDGSLFQFVVITDDLVLFDGYKHHIALYEEGLDFNLFIKLE
jgi:hypothetical protein